MDHRRRLSIGLGTSRDFRLLAHLAAAELRLDGLPAFIDAFGVAARWLEANFDTVYPRHGP
jgi:hypothetical protein